MAEHTVEILLVKDDPHLEAFRAAPQRFDLVITDQTMPNMTGETLARELRRLRPKIPIAKQVAVSLTRVVEQSAELEQIEGLWTLHVKGQVRAVLTHPLWAPYHPHLRRLAARLRIEITALPRCTLFVALHRPGWCVSQLGS